MPIKYEDLPEITTVEKGRALVKFLVNKFNEMEAKFEKRIQELETEVATLKKNSSTSSKPPSSDIVKPESEQRTKKGTRKRGGQKGRKGSNRLPFSADEIDEVSIENIESCPDCGGNLESSEDIKPIIQQVVELPKKICEVTEYHRQGGYCPCCQDTYHAPLPSGVIEGQLFGPRLQSLIGYMKGSFGVSYSELGQFCSDIVGVEVSIGFLANTVKRVSSALKAPYDELESVVPEQNSLNVDESGWKNEGKKYWVWIFCNSMIAYFTISKSRGSKVLKEVLGDVFDGVLISDFLSSYVAYATEKQQFCLAHLIRDVKFLTTLPDEISKEFGEKVLSYFRKLFKLWHEKANSPPDLFKKRADELKRQFYTEVLDTELPKGKALTLKKRLVKHWDSLFRFVELGCEPTNNLAEQNLRHAIRIRKQTQGTKSLWGRLWIARSMSVLETCKKQDKNVWLFFNQAVNAYYFNTKVPSLIK